MERFKNHIGHIALPALLVLAISAGVWAFFELEGNWNSTATHPGEPNTHGGKRQSASTIQPISPTLIEPARDLQPLAEQHYVAQGNPNLPIDTSSSHGEKTAVDTSKIKSSHPPDSTSHEPSVSQQTRTTSIKPGAVPDTSKLLLTPAPKTAGNVVDSLSLKKSVTAADTGSAAKRADTLAVQSDTTGLDTLKLSKWLNDLQRTQPQASLFPTYQYPMFLYPRSLQHQATIDSSGKYVEIRETINGKDVKIPLQVPLDEYVKLEEEYLNRQSMEDLAHQYTMVQENALGSFMQGVTNISIPIPTNPVLSIFGPPRINLRISGAVDIQGAWQNQKTNAQTLSQLGNVTNQPDFKQDVQINVNGTVGDKLTIGANWDTQNQFDYENQLQIKYKGYDDEIVKSVEAGNVSMSTPSQFIGSSQALFGIKAQMQFGPLTLTTLASQQKAQSKTLSVSGGSQSQTFTLHAYQYATNHFFIDARYIPDYESYYQTGNGNISSPYLHITQYQVYVSQTQAQPNPNLRQGYALMDLPPDQAEPQLYDSLRALTSITPVSGLVESGKFQLLDPSQYTLDPNTGVLTLNTSLTPDQTVAVAYETQDSTFGTLTFNDTSNATLVLKLVKPQYLNPGMKQAWQLMLKNIYPIGGIGLSQGSLKDVKIEYQLPGQTPQDNIQGVNLLQIFGLDKTGAGGQGPPDGQMDWNPPYDINPQTGEIILPYLQPFVEAFKHPLGPSPQTTIANPDSFAYPAVYDTTVDAAMNDATHDRFIITGQYTSSISSQYNLGFNLVQGSVKVLLNGNPLTPNVDYTVDYLTGQVTIKNQAALVPNANVQIQYETNDIFQVASKSLMGMRADYKLNDQTHLGFTVMNYSQQSPNTKVRLGEEPISNWILGFDGGTSVKLPFLTKALDALPLIQTVAPSALTVHGEAAYMLPNPNTQASPIPGDNGQGIAYIDDFEGAKRTITLPITYGAWTLASPPDSSALDSLYPGITNKSKTDFKAWTYWYNITPSVTPVKDIWPNKQVPVDQSTQPVMTVGMLDTVRGQYNRSTNIDSTLKSNPKLAWGGMMTLLSSSSTDLTTQNVNYIEVWMKVDQAPGDATMHIDLGQVSEDIFGTGVLMTEDPTGYGTLLPGHDLGLDEENDATERQKYPWIVRDPDRPWDPTGSDPDGDDFVTPGIGNTQPSAFYRVDGTEGNSVTAEGKLPDTEDLNHNGNLDEANNYFEYSVKLDTTNNPFITGGGSHGWYQFTIPLQDYKRMVGSPTLSNVQYVRVWFNGTTGPMLVDIAEMNLVGNYWRTPNQTDTTMQASVVSVFDNPGYTPPSPGLQPVDNSNPNGPIQLNEQSLALILNGLRDGDSRYVFKNYPQALDLFNYKQMKLFVHGDPSFQYIDSTNYDADVFIRFGSDSLDYYEYRQPMKTGWQDITIDFAALTAIKQKRDSVTQTIARVPANNGVPGATYWIQGNPSLQSASYFQIGVENPAHTGTTQPLYGTVWVDELRLAHADNTPGLAYLVTSSLQLADLGSVNFNFTSIDPYFHSLTSQFGSRNATRSWSISGSFNFDKLLPLTWQGTTIPFTYTHTENFSNPLYLPNSDILVSEAVQNRRSYLIHTKGISPDSAATLADSLLVSSQTLNVSDSWAIPSMRIALPTKAWYIRDLVNNITMGFNWSGSKYHDTQTRYGDQWSWNFTSGYSVQFDPMAYFTPFPTKRKEKFQTPQDFQIRYLPNSLTLSMSAGRSLTEQTLWTQTTPIITPNFTTQRSGSINWHLTNNGILNPTLDYRFSITSSLLYLETDTTGGKTTLLPDSYVFRQIFLNNGLLNFGKDYNFSEQFSLTTAPKLPLDLQRYMDLQASYNSNYNWTNSIQQGAFGVGAGYNASLQLGGNLRLKMLTDPWFGIGNAAQGQQQSREERSAPRRRGRAEFEAPDTTSTGGGKSPLGNLARVMIKVPFLDFESIGVNFSSSNSSQNGGLPSQRPGMGNFFRVPFIQPSLPGFGPSQLYQLGLVSDPNGKLNFFRKNGFPFFGFETTPSRRTPNARITDNYSNNNNLDIKTSRNLWPGARIDLSWHVGWTYNRNTTYSTDSLGNVMPNSESVLVSGQVSRSFLTLPPVFIFSMFKNGIGQVATDYQQYKSEDPKNNQSTDDQKLSKAFVNGFETLPFLDKIFGQYMPRVNYSFHWDGLEKFPLFNSFASHVSIDNAYQSTYSQNWHNNNGTGEVTDGQSIAYGFQPLLGLNVTFKNWGDAAISGSILYNTNTQYSLNPSARTIAEAYTGQLSITANYSKRGFSIPFFGLNLQNDIDVSASYSASQTTSYSYNSDAISAGGTPISGTTQTTFQINFRYVVSQRVTAAVYFKNTRVIPSVPGSLIPGTTTNEAGVNIHVSIAG